VEHNKNSTLKALGIEVGMKTKHMKTITDADIVLLAGVSGDFAPVHVCEEYAKETLFGGRIAHGIFALALISAALAKLPGVVIYLSQSAKFLEPIKIGDSITAVTEVIDKDDSKGILRIKTRCVNQNNAIVVDGESEVKIYKQPC